jgi:hypothetical protein
MDGGTLGDELIYDMFVSDFAAKRSLGDLYCD